MTFVLMSHLASIFGDDLTRPSHRVVCLVVGAFAIRISLHQSRLNKSDSPRGCLGGTRVERWQTGKFAFSRKTTYFSETRNRRGAFYLSSFYLSSLQRTTMASYSPFLGHPYRDKISQCLTSHLTWYDNCNFLTSYVRGQNHLKSKM